MRYSEENNAICIKIKCDQNLEVADNVSEGDVLLQQLVEIVDEHSVHLHQLLGRLLCNLPRIHPRKHVVHGQIERSMFFFLEKKIKTYITLID